MHKNIHMKDLKKRSSRLFKTAWPFLLVAFVVFVFFWKVFLKGLAPIPADFVVGVYYPWLDYKWGYAVGVPVKNPITTDVVSFTYPMQTFATSLLKKSTIPLWNPLILGGTPLLANFQSAPFSPTNFVYFLTDTISGWSIQIILQHVLAVIFLYLLLRHWKISSLGSILGGIVFGFSGFNLIWSQWNGHALSAAFLPLIILFEDRWLKNGKVIDGIVISLALGLQILSGYPQVVLYTLLAIAILYSIRIYKAKNIVGKTAFLFIFVALAFGLTAFQILPGAELLAYSQRAVEPHPFEWAFLPWRKVITFIAADFYGNHATKNYWGLQDYTSNTGMVGVVGFIMALLSIKLVKKKREILYCFALATASLILAFPTPVSIFLWKSGILGLNAASAHRSLVLWNISVALLAGYGFDSLRRESKSGYKFKILILLVPALLLLGFGGYALTIHQPVGLRNLVLPSVIFFLSSLVILFKPNFKLALIVFSVVELFYFGWKFTPFSPRNLVFPETPVINFLKERQVPSRVVADKVIPIDFLMAYGIETLEGYDAVYPKRVSEFIAAVNENFGNFNSIRRYAIVDNYFSPLLDLANVKYFVVLKKDIQQYLKDKKFKVVFNDKSTSILENKYWLPRAFMVYDWDLEKDGNKVLDKLLQKNFPIGKKIILEEPASVDRHIDTNTVLNSVNYSKYESQGNSISVETQKDGLLFVSDAYYSGWKAFIDGKEEKIYRADYAFRAVLVPRGIHQIKFVYNPNSFSNGLKISIISLGVLFCFLPVILRRFR